MESPAAPNQSSSSSGRPLQRSNLRSEVKVDEDEESQVAETSVDQHSVNSVRRRQLRSAEAEEGGAPLSRTASRAGSRSQKSHQSAQGGGNESQALQPQPLVPAHIPAAQLQPVQGGPDLQVQPEKTAAELQLLNTYNLGNGPNVANGWRAQHTLPAPEDPIPLPLPNLKLDGRGVELQAVKLNQQRREDSNLLEGLEDVLMTDQGAYQQAFSQDGMRSSSPLGRLIRACEDERLPDQIMGGCEDQEQGQDDEHAEFMMVEEPWEEFRFENALESQDLGSSGVDELDLLDSNGLQNQAQEVEDESESQMGAGMNLERPTSAASITSYYFHNQKSRTLLQDPVVRRFPPQPQPQPRSPLDQSQILQQHNSPETFNGEEDDELNFLGPNSADQAEYSNDFHTRFEGGQTEFGFQHSQDGSVSPDPLLISDASGKYQTEEIHKQTGNFQKLSDNPDTEMQGMSRGREDLFLRRWVGKWDENDNEIQMEMQTETSDGDQDQEQVGVEEMEFGRWEEGHREDRENTSESETRADETSHHQQFSREAPLPRYANLGDQYQQSHQSTLNSRYRPSQFENGTEDSGFYEERGNGQRRRGEVIGESKNFKTPRELMQLMNGTRVISPENRRSNGNGGEKLFWKPFIA